MTSINRKAIEEEAARLVILLDSAATLDERNAAHDWINADPRHAVAFAIAQDAWQQSAHARLKNVDLDGGEQPDASAALHAEKAEPGVSRRRLLTGLSALAASVTGVVAVGSAWRLFSQRHSTGHAERALAQLADGSAITMNGETTLDVDLRANKRLIRMVRGEALFDVAKDPDRPFIIDLDGAKIEVLGTKFNVRKRQNGVELSVTEGLVSVSSGQDFIKVPAGSTAIIRLGTSAMAVAAPSVVQQRVAWTEGFLEFDNEPLDEVLDEFNRYRRAPIMIGDPRIASTMITGRFGLNESNEFVSALESSFDIRAIAGPGGELNLMKAEDVPIK
ncbi:FecR domain-containing protein [Sphingobium sp. H39-3-25]|uniref:FecR family protein n=1 Tax=Sphingobium arseniciresistens TaxID=3030834 RepID=UPI0023B99B55|nr:FecR domain-containing protein [Sphingobium arseniciresistens]